MKLYLKTSTKLCINCGLYLRRLGNLNIFVSSPFIIESLQAKEMLFSEII